MRTGIIGCGIAMPHHILGIREVKNVDLVALCDIDKDKLHKKAQQLEVKNTYTDFSRMISSEKLDAVHILTPPKTHSQVTVKVMEQGCNVLLEKPMAITTIECDEIITAAKRNKVKLCIMHNHMFDPPILKARQLLQKGTVGNLLGFDCTFFVDRKKLVKEGSFDAGHWIHNLPLGMFGEHAIPHVLYLVLSFLGDAKVVRANLLCNNSADKYKQVNRLNVLLSSEERICNLLILDNTDYPNFTIRLFGDKAALHINLFALTMVLEKHRNLPRGAAQLMQAAEQGIKSICSSGCNASKILFGRLKRRPGHRMLIRKFYESLANNTEPPVSGEQGREVVRVMEKIKDRLDNN
ncbi:MAG: Gfo/Idh/MocA family oxidoreductase [Sedimentisphaerales bacterium]|nr:Gfo/Idh/MocA family oxidoreductase [Sedimentisphaerales bacterium]